MASVFDMQQIQYALEKFGDFINGSGSGHDVSGWADVGAKIIVEGLRSLSVTVVRYGRQERHCQSERSSGIPRFSWGKNRRTVPTGAGVRFLGCTTREAVFAFSSSLLPVRCALFRRKCCALASVRAAPASSRLSETRGICGSSPAGDIETCFAMLRNGSPVATALSISRRSELARAKQVLGMVTTPFAPCGSLVLFLKHLRFGTQPVLNDHRPRTPWLDRLD